MNSKCENYEKAMDWETLIRKAYEYREYEYDRDEVSAWTKSAEYYSHATDAMILDVSLYNDPERIILINSCLMAMKYCSAQAQIRHNYNEAVWFEMQNKHTFALISAWEVEG